MEDMKAAAIAESPQGTRVTTFMADVADESEMLAFATAVRTDHATDHINVLFNTAGIGGGGSFVADPRRNGTRRSRRVGPACTTAAGRSCRCCCAATRGTW